MCIIYMCRVGRSLLVDGWCLAAILHPIQQRVSGVCLLPMFLPPIMGSTQERATCYRSYSGMAREERRDWKMGFVCIVLPLCSLARSFDTGLVWSWMLQAIRQEATKGLFNFDKAPFFTCCTRTTEWFYCCCSSSILLGFELHESNRVVY